MDCKQVNQVVYRFYDNELEERERDPFRSHLEDCPGCARQARYIEKLLLIVRTRCTRCNAPERLTRRILISFAHRRESGPQH